MSNAITTTVDFSSKKWIAQKVVPSCKDTTGCAWTYFNIHVNNDEEWWTESLWCELHSIITFGEIRCGLKPHRNFPSYHEYDPTVLPFHIWQHNEGRITTLHNYHEWGIMKVMERIGLHIGHFMCLLPENQPVNRVCFLCEVFVWLVYALYDIKRHILGWLG